MSVNTPHGQWQQEGVYTEPAWSVPIQQQQLPSAQVHPLPQGSSLQRPTTKVITHPPPLPARWLMLILLHLSNSVSLPQIWGRQWMTCSCCVVNCSCCCCWRRRDRVRGSTNHVCAIVWLERVGPWRYAQLVQAAASRVQPLCCHMLSTSSALDVGALSTMLHWLQLLGA